MNSWQRQLNIILMIQGQKVLQDMSDQMAQICLEEFHNMEVGEELLVKI